MSYYRSGRLNVFHEEHVLGANGDVPDSFKLVAVVDPEDRDAVERLLKSFGAAELAAHDGRRVDCRSGSCWISNMQIALREFASPQQRVYSHITVMRDGEIREALCGKVWRPTSGVSVVGKCPDCRDLAKEWTA